MSACRKFDHHYLIRLYSMIPLPKTLEDLPQILQSSEELLRNSLSSFSFVEARADSFKANITNSHKRINSCGEAPHETLFSLPNCGGLCTPVLCGKDISYFISSLSSFWKVETLTEKRFLEGDFASVRTNTGTSSAGCAVPDVSRHLNSFFDS
eukprot:m.38298 g.38298  ORF g.38298 m.38298 type:complete len:153 (+) comp32553_c0_seq4:343-801(+)